MPKTRPPYSPEFRRQMVDLVRAGRDPTDLAREFEPTAQSISHWVAQADRQEGRREEKAGGLTAAERDELARLRRENKQLRLERDSRLSRRPAHPCGSAHFWHTGSADRSPTARPCRPATAFDFR
jgi:transposase